MSCHVLLFCSAEYTAKVVAKEQAVLAPTEVVISDQTSEDCSLMT